MLKLQDWLWDHLVCPRDHLSLQDSDSGATLVCPNAHQYPVVDGVPVMLLDEVSQTIGVMHDSLREARKPSQDDPYYVDAVGCSAEERDEIRRLIALGQTDLVDPVVQYVLVATNGNLYKPLLGKLREYPIPDIRLPLGGGQYLLDIGCNWGRWCIAASRRGYRSVGIDPSLGSVLAAQRVAKRLGATAAFVVGDARFLPFAANSFDRVFSYSVLQHFSKEDVALTLQQVAGVLRPGGESLIQMAARFGIRSMQHQVRRGFRTPKDFEVRYWTPGELRKTFTKLIGATRLSVDGYFGLGIQTSDLGVMPGKYRAVIRTSEVLRKLSQAAPALGLLADSLYVHSRRI
jgi:SAM-dependent methyltransferase/uncharacterized protein YbaR (Trm112 family)